MRPPSGRVRSLSSCRQTRIPVDVIQNLSICHTLCSTPITQLRHCYEKIQLLERRRPVVVSSTQAYRFSWTIVPSPGSIEIPSIIMVQRLGGGVNAQLPFFVLFYAVKTPRRRSECIACLFICEHLFRANWVRSFDDFRLAPVVKGYFTRQRINKNPAARGRATGTGLSWNGTTSIRNGTRLKKCSR